MRMRWILASATAAGLSFALPLAAQTREVVQATPSASAVAALNRNLALLSRSPQDVNALLGAGQAALDLGDVQAANGFFTRANLVNPSLGKAKLGLAVVQIALKQPEDAAANFDAAAALGEQATGQLADRGLAYDLTGQQEKAQRDYLAALRENPSEKNARLRYAVSLGISGKIAEADKQLEVALADGDREAWRMRAFIYAMNGKMAEARKVTQAVMPKGLADALDPYMQRLPLLTAAQKGSAAYFGDFPANVLRLAAPEPVKEVQVAVATERDNGRSSRRRRNSETSSRPTSNAGAPATPSPSSMAMIPPPPASMPASEPPRPASTAPATQLAMRPATPPPAAPRTVQAPQPATATPSSSTTSPATAESRPSVASETGAAFAAPATVTAAATPAPVQPPRSTGTQGPTDPLLAQPQLAQASPITTPSGASAPANQVNSAVQTTPVAPSGTAAPGFSASSEPLASEATHRSLADALSSLDVPAEERSSSGADLDAVKRIQDQRRKAAEAAAAKARAEAEAKAKAEALKKAEAERKAKLAANPSRSWVQIATGRDVDALAFDLRRLRRTYDDAIGELSGWTAEWGATRRLLVGPFKKVEDARAVAAKISKSGGDAFVWQSDAGEEVDKIGGK